MARTCRLCGQPESVLSKYGWATCPTCKQQNMRAAQNRFRASNRPDITEEEAIAQMGQYRWDALVAASKEPPGDITIRQEDDGSVLLQVGTQKHDGWAAFLYLTANGERVTTYAPAELQRVLRLEPGHVYRLHIEAVADPPHPLYNAKG